MPMYVYVKVRKLASSSILYFSLPYFLKQFYPLMESAVLGRLVGQHVPGTGQSLARLWWAYIVTSMLDIYVVSSAKTQIFLPVNQAPLPTSPLPPFLFFETES